LLVFLLSKTAPHGGLNTTLVLTTEDTEVTLLTPVFVPGVGNEPVFDTVVRTIAKDTDGVTTFIAATDVLVDTTSVSQEILIDREGTLARTVGGKLGHHISLTTDGVNLGTLSFVALEIDARIINASLLASRSGLDARAGIGAARDVVIAAGEGVLDALLSNNTSALPVVVSARGITTIARTSARAAVHIFSRKDDINTVLDALTVRHRLNSTESPARTAFALITDHGHGLAVRPVSTSIEFLRSSKASSTREGTKRRVLGIVPSELLIGTKKSLDLLTRKLSSGAIKRGSPEVLDAVDVLDSITSDMCRNTDSNCNNSNYKLHHFLYY